MDMLTYARNAKEAVALVAGRTGAEFKAGGTDVMARYNGRAMVPGSLIHLGQLSDLRGITPDGNHLRVGAMTVLREWGDHPVVTSEMKVLREAILFTATPQIRAMATAGGALCQRPRCVYLRHPDFLCRKRGGSECYARTGDNVSHAIFDNRICAATHPSTVAAALLALDAVLHVRIPGQEGVQTLSMNDFLDFNMGDARVENALSAGALIESILVPRANLPQRQVYLRASPRHLADWADVEVAAALWMEGSTVADARIVLGAVGRTPVRATETELRLKGHALTANVISQAAALCTTQARPLSHNGFKLPLARNSVQTALEGLIP